MSVSAQKTAALVVAAGRGTRAGAGPAKQYRLLAGRAVLARAVAAFTTHPGIDCVLVVIAAPDEALFREHVGDAVEAVVGGATRSASVRAGLEALAGRGLARVLIHDAARPLVSRAVIDRVLGALKTHDGAAPALAVNDALWQGEAGVVSAVQPRDALFRAQTPQGFRFETILAAHRAPSSAAADDDVAVARAAGCEVAIVEGDETNFKITQPGDFDRAEKLMGAMMDVRMGSGYDVHRFAPGEAVTLNGIKIAHTRALAGHSDADVAMHAVTDALYGALAEGDIGQHFPPCDPQWKGAASRIFLEHAANLVAERGFRITNIDCTIICEYPKISPYSKVMRENLEEITGVDAARISVKATTSERLGFTGREEGIAAMATATLVQA